MLKKIGLFFTVILSIGAVLAGVRISSMDRAATPTNPVHHVYISVMPSYASP